MPEPGWSTRRMRTRSFRDALLHVVAAVPFTVAWATVKGRPLASVWHYPLIYGALVAVFSAARRRRPAGRVRNRKIELRPSSTVTAVAAVAMLAILVAVATAFRRSPPQPAVWPVFGVMVALVALFLVGMSRWELRVDELGIESRSVFGSITTIRWSSVTRLESHVRVQKGFSHQMIRVVTPVKTLDIPCSFDGVGDFARLALEHVADVLERCPKERELLRSLATERANDPLRRRRV